MKIKNSIKNNNSSEKNLLNFEDLQEIDNQEQINFHKTQEDKNEIDSIEYSDNELDSPDELIKKLGKESSEKIKSEYYLTRGKKESVNQNDSKTNNEKYSIIENIKNFPAINSGEKDNEDLNKDQKKFKKKESGEKISNKDKSEKHLDKIEIDNKNNTENIFKEKAYKTKNSDVKKNDLLNKSDNLNIKENKTNQEELNDDKNFADTEELDEIDTIEEAELLNESDNIDFLINKIDKETDTAKYPGKIDITEIDKTILKTDTEEFEKKIDKNKKKEESFGVKRVEVYYTIDKQIYSSKSQASYSKKALKKANKGILIPAVTAISLFMILVIGVVSSIIYFRNQKEATLEDTFQKQNSILEKLAKQQREEAERAKRELENEKKKLADELKRRENIISEELEKEIAKLNNEFNIKLKNIESTDISKEEMEKLKKEIEQEKLKAIENVKLEKNRKLEEQQNILQEREKQIAEKEKQLNEEARLALEKENQARQEAEEELDKIRKNKEEIKKFNDTVYSLIAGSMSEFRNNNYEAALVKLNTILDYYTDRKDFIDANDELKSKRETDIFFVETITGLISNSTGSGEFEKKYSTIVDKFEKITEAYKTAEILYSQKKFSQSTREYEKVLGEFEEVNVSYEQIRKIEIETQNIIARNNYKTAQENIINNRYREALDNLKTLITEAPLSNYTNNALNEIINVSDKLYSSSKENDNEQLIAKNNIKAKALFDQAAELKEQNNFAQAIQLFNQVIIDYPASDYTRLALQESNFISEILKENEYSEYDRSIKENFNEYYKKYQDYKKNKDYEKARQYYFAALKNAFDIYTNNSISEFKMIEDEYIDLLLAENSKNKESSNSENLTKINQLEAEKQQLEIEKTNLIDELNSLKEELEIAKNHNTTDNTDNDSINAFKTQIIEKDREIERLQQFIRDNKAALTENEIQDKIASIKKELEAEKEKSDILKKQLYEYYEKNSKIASEKEKIKELEEELNKYKSMYEELEAKMLNSKITKTEREKITKELEEVYKKKLAIEKEKLKKENMLELERLKKELTEKDIIDENYEMEGFIFARITDIVSDSVAFQFIAVDSSIKNKIKNGDTVQIIRLTKVNNETNEILVGYMTITSVKQDSIYGRGKITSYTKSFTAEKGDLLKN